VLVVNPAGRPPAERCNTHHVHMHEYNASFLESLWTRETYQAGNSGRPRRGEAHQTSDGTCVYASCVYIKGRGCSLYPREQTSDLVSERETERSSIDRRPWRGNDKLLPCLQLLCSLQRRLRPFLQVLIAYSPSPSWSLIR
jgi:hypothetical protein